MIKGPENMIKRGPETGKYRFPIDFIPPVPPEGKVVTKFEGDVAFIAESTPDEPRNSAGYTETQVIDLIQLAQARDAGELERRPLHGTSISIVDFKRA